MRTSETVGAVAAAGGVARSTTLQRLGVSKYAIAEAVRVGALVRERRVWVALPGADGLLRLAARHGVVLSCVTAARRLGLWVPHDDLHVACDAHSGVVPPLTTVHRFTPVVARHPDLLVDGVENTLVAVAACLPFEGALAVWESALRQGLIDIETLRGFPLRGQARDLLLQASPFRDSGLESFFIVRLRWLRVPLRFQVWVHGHRVDVLIGDRLVVQLDGGHHVGAQRDSDNAHDAQLRLRGYQVIRVGYRQVIDDWPSVNHVILQAVGQRLHLRR